METHKERLLGILENIEILAEDATDLEDFKESLEEYFEELEAMEDLGDDVATGVTAGVVGGGVVAGAAAYGAHRASKVVGDKLHTVAKTADFLGKHGKTLAKVGAGVAAVATGGLGLHHFLKKNGGGEAHTQAAQEADSHASQAAEHATQAAQGGEHMAEHIEEGIHHANVGQSIVDHLHNSGAIPTSVHEAASKVMGHVSSLLSHFRR